MTLSAYNTDYRLDPEDDITDDPHWQDLSSEKERLETYVRELEEEISWLKFALEKFGMLDAAEALIPESHFTENTSVAA